MITRVQSDEEMEETLKACYRKEMHMARLALSSENVQEWIEGGRFKRLKEEVNIYNGVKFGCLKNYSGCQYYFFSKNKNVIDRIINLMVAIMDDKPGHLIDFKPNEGWRKSVYYRENKPIGEFNACSLF